MSILMPSMPPLVGFGGGGGGPPTTPWDTGWVFPTAHGTITQAGSSVNWTQTQNILSDNNLYTSSATITSGQYTSYLRAYTFGLSLPAGAVVVGIEMRYGIKTSTTGSHRDKSVRLLQGTSLLGVDRKAATAWNTSEVQQTRGGAADMWGTTLTKADVEASNFGCALSIESITGTAAPQCDYIQIKVHALVP